MLLYGLFEFALELRLCLVHDFTVWIIILLLGNTLVPASVGRYYIFFGLNEEGLDRPAQSFVLVKREHLIVVVKPLQLKCLFNYRLWCKMILLLFFVVGFYHAHVLLIYLMNYLARHLLIRLVRNCWAGTVLEKRYVKLFAGYKEPFAIGQHEIASL